MSKKLFFKGACLLSFCLSYPLSAGFVDRPPEGFVWYNERDKESAEEKKEKEGCVAVSVGGLADAARARNKARGEVLDNAIQIAIDSPTLENAVRAQRAQKVIFDRATEFGESWKMASLLDASLALQKQPTNPVALKLSEVESRKKERAGLRAISKDWGLFLFLKRGCSHCESFAPILDKFARRFGFEVLAVSAEGGPWGPFEGAKATGFLSQYNPEGAAPMLFVVEKTGAALFPVARGHTNSDELTKNIIKVVAEAARRGVKK